MVTRIKLQPAMLVPNVGMITREMSSASPVQLVLRRFFTLSLFNMIKLMLNNIKFAQLLLSKNFAAGIKLLCELDVIEKNKKMWVLHNQMVDMAIALRNPQILTLFFALSKTYGFQPGIVTYNTERCIQFLSEVHLPKNLVVFCPKKDIFNQEFLERLPITLSFI